MRLFVIILIVLDCTSRFMSLSDHTSHETLGGISPLDLAFLHKVLHLASSLQPSTTVWWCSSTFPGRRFLSWRYDYSCVDMCSISFKEASVSSVLLQTAVCIIIHSTITFYRPWGATQATRLYNDCWLTLTHHCAGQTPQSCSLWASVSVIAIVNIRLIVSQALPLIWHWSLRFSTLSRRTFCRSRGVSPLP
jgi:hypothetical protein